MLVSVCYSCISNKLNSLLELVAQNFKEFDGELKNANEEICKISCNPSSSITKEIINIYSKHRMSNTQIQ